MLTSVVRTMNPLLFPKRCPENALGRFVFTGEAEFGPQVVPNTTCPAGTLEFHLVQNTNVFFFQATGEQLYFTYTPGSVGCYDPTTNKFTGRFPGVFSGGTGRFAHATGAFEDDDVATFLAGDAKGHLYSAFFGTVTGTIKRVGEKED